MEVKVDLDKGGKQKITLRDFGPLDLEAVAVEALRIWCGSFPAGDVQRWMTRINRAMKQSYFEHRKPDPEKADGAKVG